MTKGFVLCLLALGLAGCTADVRYEPILGRSKSAESQPAESKPEEKPAFEKAGQNVVKTVPNGRVEKHGNIRVVHLFGSPEQRGRAHGELLGDEIVGLIRSELAGTFGRQPQLLGMARGALKSLVYYPEAIEQELKTLYETIAKSGVDLTLKQFRRKIDFRDFLLVNALDIFGTMGCSGFTVWDKQVQGGGVLTTRNFDWPVSGRHITENCIVLVQHPTGKNSFASLSWPGYVATVTGINQHGIAAFLHVGNGRNTMKPRPESYPTAIAARLILEQATPENAFEIAHKTLKETSPPASFITRIVLPESRNGSPVRVFEATHNAVEIRQSEGPCVVTNHFMSKLALRRYRDSIRRFETITDELEDFLGAHDHQISPAEAWQAMAAVQANGRRFATLHSLVFRSQPWYFEVAVGTTEENGSVVGAPRAKLHQRIPRDVLFR